MDKKILFIRNYINGNLLSKTYFYPSKENCEMLYISGKDGLFGKKLLEFCFIEKKYQDSYDYIVFIDEDCLILDEDSIYGIIDEMEKTGNDIAGMKDGNQTWVRMHRYDVPNLFFTIFKCDKLKKFSNETYDSWNIPILRFKDMESSSFEGYYKTLTYMVYGLGMKFLPLYAYDCNVDHLSTIISYKDKEVCVHTWYAREYSTNESQKNRINKVIDSYLKAPSKILIKDVMGGIGNILFSIMGAYYKAKKEGYQCEFKYGHLNHDFLKDLKDNNMLPNNFSISDIEPSSDYTIDDEIFSGEYKSFSNEDKLYIRGYRQSPKYWDNNEDFVFNNLPINKDIINIIKEGYPEIDFDQCVSIHVRRGDYSIYNNRIILGEETAEYYMNAIEKCGRDKTYIIISNDIDWCKQNFKGINCIYFNRALNAKSFITDFYVQTMCGKNIISNSTFSWWAAYLNRHQDKKVYYPAPFFNLMPSSDIIPNDDRWIGVESKFESTKVSVIIPCYNIDKDKFSRCIDSIESQNIMQKNLEIILVDDKSTDDTLSMLQNYAQKYNNIIVTGNTINMGVGEARNTGLKIATGKYVSFLDHDDYYTNDGVLHTLLNAAPNDDDIVLGGYNLMSSGENIIYNQTFNIDTPIYSYKDDYRLFNLNPALGSKLFRREFLYNNHIWFNDHRIGEDAVFIATSYIKSKSTIVLNVPIYNYELREMGSLTKTKNFRNTIDELQNKIIYNQLLLKNGIDIHTATFNIDYIISNLLNYNFTKNEYLIIFDYLLKIDSQCEYNGEFNDLISAIKSNNIDKIFKK